MQFTLEPALTAPLTIEVTVEPPKNHAYYKTVETQQTIRTQDVFPDFPDDLVISETEPESSQEVGGAGVASSIRKRKQAMTMPATKRTKPE